MNMTFSVETQHNTEVDTKLYIYLQYSINLISMMDSLVDMYTCTIPGMNIRFLTYLWITLLSLSTGSLQTSASVIEFHIQWQLAEHLTWNFMDYHCESTLIGYQLWINLVSYWI